MSTFKQNQLIRVIECILKAASFDKKKIDAFIKKYTSYEEYEVAIKELILVVYEMFYNKEKEVYEYSIDMIKNISSNYFKSKEEIFNYINSNLSKEV